MESIQAIAIEAISQSALIEVKFHEYVNYDLFVYFGMLRVFSKTKYPRNPPHFWQAQFLGLTTSHQKAPKKGA
jgi:hypothetical protein